MRQHAGLPCPPQGIAQPHAHWVGDAIQPSHPVLSPASPAFNLSQHQVFSTEWVLPIRWPKYWRFSISPSNEYSVLISFRIDRFHLQGTNKCLLQHHTLKSSILMAYGNLLNLFIYQFLHHKRELIIMTLSHRAVIKIQWNNCVNNKKAKIINYHWIVVLNSSIILHLSAALFSHLNVVRLNLSINTIWIFSIQVC